MEYLPAVINTIFSWQIMLALLVGGIGGVVIGAVPGVGPAVAIAIMLPATYSMEPLVGLTLLLGFYGSSMYGGAIPAILINTPGTAVNALTTYDGYPMAKNGAGGRALALAYGASFIGGIISVLALMTLSPVLASIAPMFGSREILLACILGMVLVIITHRGHQFAAASLLFFGMFLASIGREPARYSTVFTYDTRLLSSGVNLIVVVLGLFAISQALILLVGRDEPNKPVTPKGGTLAALRELIKMPKVYTSGSLFGVFTGIIPGVGEFLAQFLSYSTARSISPAPEKFGFGAPDGIVASESANNAVPAAAMIPLLVLGIPGEALTAMMLSVFYVHNVIPGAGLFSERFDFVLGLYTSLILLNIIAFVFLLCATRPLLKIVQIPNRFLGMAILLLAFVGVYSLRNSAVDCIIAAGFGLFALVLRRLDLPIVPIILGMVLGDIAQAKFRAAMARVDSFWDLISRPAAMVIFIMICTVIIWQLYDNYKHRYAQPTAN